MGSCVGVADERLGGQVEDDFGGEVLQGGLEGGGVADVAADVFDDGADAGRGEEVGVGAGVERVAADDGAFGGEPEGEPAAFEAGVAGEEDALALPGEGGACSDHRHQDTWFGLCREWLRLEM